MFSENQQHILTQANLSLEVLNEPRLFEIINNPDLASQLSDAELEEFLAVANALYRGGEEIVSDEIYDFVFTAELAKRNPEHPFLNRVEPEPAFYGKTVELPVKMLSTDKAYSQAEIERWTERIKKAALELGKDFESLTFKVTPKLDGYAAYDDGEKLYTRGDGVKGTDISRVFERGLQVANQGQRGLGAGEVVISKSYFATNLAAQFDNSRNFQASIIKEKDLSSHAEQAIQDNAAVFYPFALLPCWTGTANQLFADFENTVKTIWHKLDFDVDGVVLEILDDEIKEFMGATRHHHRWQIAYKENLNSAEVKVLGVTPQTSRSGRITPVAELEPTRLSGALIQRATAHNYQMVVDKGIGAGAIIRLARSGEVIPKIEEVLKAVTPDVPTHCPSCGQELVWDGKFLMCTNTLDCPAQVSNTMEHFFKTLGNNDGFGAATITKLYDHNIRNIGQIYQLKAQDFTAMGFGAKQSINLVNQLIRSRTEEIEDWRFLAAFGVFRIGRSPCEKLLKKYTLEQVFNLTEAEIIAIEGFAEKTAAVVIKGFKRIQPLFQEIYALGFTLKNSTDIKSPVSNSEQTGHPLAGKLLVFTGTMLRAKRDDLIKEAKQFGAKVGTSVTSKTDYLIAGEKVGETKLNDAHSKGVKVISEDEYFELLSSHLS
jgi:DNA ligase (NAD+)